MSQFNYVCVRGNCTDKPELSYTTKGTAVSKFNIGLTDRYKDAQGTVKEKANFFSIACWKKLGELCAEHLDKGQSVIVQGRLTYDTWKDKTNGETRHRVYITASAVEFGRKAKPKDNQVAPDNTTIPEEPNENQEVDDEDPSC